MILLTFWKGFKIEWKIKGYSATREFDGYRIPSLFPSIEKAKQRINQIIEH